MNIIELSKKEIKKVQRSLLMVLILAGLSSIFLLQTIYDAINTIANNQFDYKHLLIYFTAVWLFLWTRKYMLDTSFTVIENLVAKIRVRIGRKICQAELSTIENIGTASIYTRVTQDMVDITSLSSSIISSIQSAFIVVFMLLYTAYLSISSCLIMLIGISIGLYKYAKDYEKYTENWYNLSKMETIFFKKFNHILGGFKEIRINHRKNHAVFASFKKANQRKRKKRISAIQLYNRNSAISFTFFYATLTAIVFVVPYYSEEHPLIIIELVSIMLFIMGNLGGISSTVIYLSIAENAATNVLNLEKELDKALKKQQTKGSIADANEQKPIVKFKQNICLENLCYYYDNENTASKFGIGPLNLTIQKGEIIFITGGNGSGKSTFLKTFIGLYFPKGGQIYIDRDLENGKSGTLINSRNYEQYRELFTLIFTDFHLFDQLYGLEHLSEKVVNDLLVEMEIAPEKTQYKNGGFTNTRLSSGQKKRLALATCILEDKEIYIFDEVAADLDPEYRDTYYYQILPALKARNKTIFVVSHDKSYWDVGDRILELREGKFYNKHRHTKILS